MAVRIRPASPSGIRERYSAALGCTTTRQEAIELFKGEEVTFLEIPARFRQRFPFSDCWGEFAYFFEFQKFLVFFPRNERQVALLSQFLGNGDEGHTLLR